MNGAAGEEQDNTGENHEGDSSRDDMYDPEQPMDEKRRIRKEYRDLTTGLMSDRARDPDTITASSLRTKIQTANKFFNKVKNPAEAVLDSTFLSTVGDLALQEARKLKVGGDYFDTDDFVAKLKVVVMGGPAASGSQRRNGAGVRRRGRGESESDEEEQEEEDDDDDNEGAVRDPLKGWDFIGTLATRHTLRVPPIDFMLGPLAIPQKKKIVKTRKAKEARLTEADKVQATEVIRDDLQEDKGTTELVVHVADILEQAGGESGINLFRFLINPASFTQTVENIFFTSFLVKDRKAAIELIDSEDHPEGDIGDAVIFASDPPGDEERQEGDLEARQIVLEMDMKTWKDAIKAYNITESVIPHRNYQERVRGKWYAG